MLVDDTQLHNTHYQSMSIASHLPPLKVKVAEDAEISPTSVRYVPPNLHPTSGRIMSDFDPDQRYLIPSWTAAGLPSLRPAATEHKTNLEFLPPSDSVPPSLLSPAFTPPTTPSIGTTTSQRRPTSIPVDSTDGVREGAGAKRPRLLESLPQVRCLVGATIPTYARQDPDA